jgi:predicted nucleic acid-binding protein
MSFVVDASLAGAWFLPDEHNEAATALALRLTEGGVIAPNLFWHEVRNLLVSARRANRLDDEVLAGQLAALAVLPIADAGQGDGPATARLALLHRLTAYDAVYLALAEALALPLATFDAALRRAARAEGVAVLPPSP